MIINSVAVLGAGTMGAQIALHCANAGIPSLLLDLTPDLAREGEIEQGQEKHDANRTAEQAMQEFWPEDRFEFFERDAFIDLDILRAGAVAGEFFFPGGIAHRR